MRSYGISGGVADSVNGCNGVHEEGLRILIVGAGIGGLTAAIALRRQGHKVLVIMDTKFDTGFVINTGI